MRCRPSLYAGMDRTVLQAALTKAQQALIDLQNGSKGVTFSYGQGDGIKTVSYTPATLQNLVALIRDLQAELGIIRHARPRTRLVFR